MLRYFHESNTKKDDSLSPNASILKIIAGYNVISYGATR